MVDQEQVLHMLELKEQEIVHQQVHHKEMTEEIDFQDLILQLAEVGEQEVLEEMPQVVMQEEPEEQDQQIVFQDHQSLMLVEEVELDQ
jgi:hypothetical protein